LRQYRALINITRPTAIPAVSRDPDDDQVLACALACDAKLIVTRDKDLLHLGSFENIRILAAASALAFFAGKSE
jgi:predicted nucleic acid-binding protein